MGYGQQKPPPGSQLNPIHPLGQGLDAWWLLNENGGLWVRNVVNDRIGLLTNGPLWYPGQSGSCLSFDGSNDLVALTGVTSYANTAGHTYSAWVYTAGTATYQWVIGTESDTLGTALAIKSNRQITFWYQGASVSKDSTGSIPASVWTHIAVSWNPTDTKVRFYINGVLDSASAAVATTWSALGTGAARIGMYHSGTSFPFNGRIDNVKIWNRVLGGNEIALDRAEPYAAIDPPTRRRTFIVPAATTGSSWYYNQLLRGAA